MHDIFKKADDQMYRDKLSESPGIRSRTIVKILDTLYLRNKREMSHSRQFDPVVAKTFIEKVLDKPEQNSGN